VAYDDNPNVLDRVIAAFIAAIFAIPIALGIEAIANFVGLETTAAFSSTLVFFAGFAFIVPRQSRDFLTKVWHGIIGAIRDLRLWW
jgi:hypothetical protein